MNWINCWEEHWIWLRGMCNLWLANTEHLYLTPITCWSRVWMTEITGQITCLPSFLDFPLKWDGLYSPIHLAWIQSSTSNVFPTAEINVPYNDWVNVIWSGFYVVLVNTSDVVVFTWSAWQFPSSFGEYIKEFSTILYFFLFAVQNCTARKLLECVRMRFYSNSLCEVILQRI